MTNFAMHRPRSSAVLCAAIALACLMGAGSAAAEIPESRLLATYQPVTVFDPAEPFRPTTAQSFITDAVLERLTASEWLLVKRNPGPGNLPVAGTGVWRLNQEPCSPTLPLGGLACYVTAWTKGHGAPVVYGRVARLEDRMVLQYWYFYYDNTYSYTYPPSDLLWQAHEGDWEVVNVVLTATEAPLYVGYSQHCTGARRSWAVTPRAAETHPIVYVAIGSHANEFSPGVHPIPIQCIPTAAIALLRQLRLPLPHDVAGVGDVAGPPGTGGDVSPIRKIDDSHPSWVAFPGFWGELQYFHAAPVGTVPLGASPVGPAYHGVWRDPLGALATWPEG